jgi:PD-(D/E)XK nuclease superfamily protein
MAKSAVHVASVRDTSGHVASPVLASVFRVKEHLNALTNAIIGAALAVHDELGPGLLESAYEACLTFELLQRRLSIERQKALPLPTGDRHSIVDIVSTSWWKVSSSLKSRQSNRSSAFTRRSCCRT